MLILQSLLKERKYPFILFLFVLLIFVTFLLISNSQSFVFVNYTGVNVTETQSPSQNGTSSIIAANMKSLPSLQPCEGPGMVDYIPCLDNWKAIKTFKKLERKERHCPTRPSPRCLVPLPKGYKTPVPWPKSRDMIWYDNVPHPKLVQYKKEQHWVVKSGEYLVFPGGGTQFKEGVAHYIEAIEKED